VVDHVVRPTKIRNVKTQESKQLDDEMEPPG
jgi:hypothetical protein